MKLSITKILAAIITACTVCGLSAVALAFSPDRPVYTVAHPANHVVLDSVTDNPRFGDEQSFFGAADAANPVDSAFSHTLAVHDGQEIVLRVYIDNNANQSMNGSNLTGSGVAKKTQVRVKIPTVSGTSMSIYAFVSANNAQPKIITDMLTATSSQKFSLSYEPGSATLNNNALSAAGIKLSDNIVKNGTQIGYSKLDGALPGGFQYAALVTLKATVHMANATAATAAASGTTSFTISQSVALTTDKSWSTTVTANPGQKIKYQIGFTNTGTTQLNDVQVSTTLTNGVSLVGGSVKLFNSTNKNGKTISDDVTKSTGFNVGAYSPNANGYVELTATVPAASKLQCGENDLTNSSNVGVGASVMASTTLVKVVKTCAAAPAPAPVVTPTPAPTTPAAPTVPAPTTNGALTNTGPGDVIALFAAATVVGTIARYLYVRMRLSKQ